ncbi:nitroreductase [Humibacillus xanthopallidus]|uniref:Nitroreductase n=1 Tax=Humibacillus xanthopallidus TaxID=412689 RepID=A0A543PRT5_9MICO|nr:nitroreductase family protein [Humibacillus xanthopallidus]TQN46788.1 nitroreductase [Humibacillus xanthopallidus]
MREDGERDVSDETVTPWRHTAPESSGQPDVLTPLLRERESVMIYDRTHVLSTSALRAILEAARWAPSAGNSQPWGFIVGLRGDETHAAMVDVLSSANQVWAPAASAIILTLHQVATDEDHEIAYSDYAMFDLGQAVAHITVQARSMGLQVRQFGGFDHRAAAERFDVPAHWAVTTGIALGLPAEAGADDALPEWLRARSRLPRSRLPLEAFVHSGKFGHAADFLTD